MPFYIYGLLPLTICRFARLFSDSQVKEIFAQVNKQLKFVKTISPNLLVLLLSVFFNFMRGM